MSQCSRDCRTSIRTRSSRCRDRFPIRGDRSRSAAQELTALSEESISGDATVAQSSEPVTASESIELPQDAIAEVIAVSPETTAPVQVLETQTDALLTSAEQITHPIDAPLPVEQTISVVVQSTVETFTETLTITDTSTETTNAALVIELAQVSLD